VCKLLNHSRLATLDDIHEAYRLGADFCNYGWTKGGIAAFPLQPSTWSALQHSRQPKKCGIYGVNGGYFDKSLKFGVNCFGIKPHKRGIDALSIELDPLATSEETESEVEDARSQALRAELKRVPILPTREISPHPPPLVQQTMRHPTYVTRRTSVQRRRRRAQWRIVVFTRCCRVTPSSSSSSSSSFHWHQLVSRHHLRRTVLMWEEEVERHRHMGPLTHLTRWICTLCCSSKSKTQHSMINRCRI
jgi:hypothetical protein